ncbi:MAG: hypothetical protein L0Y79_06995 [Chlorobi bacterium]|nr:hypothetical protein [Chlorobiota bacterium]MCI0714788.1 hypothetical protein [Chlorobiota bacterium]
MKSIKSVLLAFIMIMGLIGINTSETNAGPRVRIYVGTPKIHKPGPNYVWVEGHYKINKYGKLVWVPGHWKRV